MSKLQDKAKNLNFDEIDDPSPVRNEPPKPTAPERPRTGVGVLSASFGRERELKVENDSLKGQLQKFEDAVIVELIDANRIKPSRFANRHDLAFSSPEFVQLREEIASAGRNVQPIKVRKVSQGSGDAQEFEIVFGHRRHRACLELGIPVAAIVADLNDQQLFAEMDRENRARQNLSAWEQGTMYKRALDSGVFPTQSAMAGSLGIDQGNISKAVQLAGLPDELVAAFSSPLDLQYRFAPALKAALEKDRGRVLSGARELSLLNPKLPSAQVMARLLGVDSAPQQEPPKVFSVDGKTVASFDKDAKGAISVRIKAGVLPASKERKLTEFLERLFD
jgi:ParB family chromosome partitioning protein